MTTAARLITGLEHPNVRIELDGDRLVVDGALPR
jgi:hypothetical protein